MDRSTAASHSPHTFVSRILQVALGLFVTTSDLPPLPAKHELLSYDCSFDSDCRWSSVGGRMDRWRIARGEPDSLLWLAATGTMQLPREPFVLIEQRGQPVDALMTDAIRCQKGFADLSFMYWAIGSADLEICLTDLDGSKFNCTGMLDSRIMPGKVSLKIPELQTPFRIMIAPNNLPGVLIIDDIRYDASTCETMTTFPIPGIRGRPDITTVIPPKVFPWTMRKINSPSPTTEEPTTTTEAATSTTEQTTTTEIITEPPTTAPPPSAKTFAPVVPDIVKEVIERVTRPSIPSTTTDTPFELMIHGNKTTPMFDRRSGMIITESTKLLCDFNNEFACQWGAEAGRWAIIEKGAIPSLDNSVSDPSLLPTYPAALVLQGTAMLTSDPIRCQTGPGKILFRYWSNGDILLQVCALGYGIDSNVIECVDQTPSARHERSSLALFDLTRTIKEPFTLNIVPQWEPGLKNRYLVIDEIAYIGECSHEATRGRSTEPPLVIPPRATTPTTTTEEPTTTTTEPPTTTTATTTQEITTSTEEEVTESEETEDPWSPEEETAKPTLKLVTLPPSTTKEYTIMPFTKKKPYPPRIIHSTQRPIYPEDRGRGGPPSGTRRPNNRWTIPVVTTTESYKSEDYCEMLNCNFDDSACNYLNHGLTKKPWTLRNRGYGYPLTGTTDIRPTSTNGQFVSAILDAGDIAILESPKFNATRSLNVLLFQYYRPSQMTTIRLCLGSRYTNPMRSVASFTQCPSILRSVTSKNAFRWNTVHVQLPPGTTHFFLVAHNSERSEGRAAMAIDNMRVAICDPRGFAPDYMEDIIEPAQFMEFQNV